MSKDVIPVSSMTSLTSVCISVSPFSLCPWGKPQYPLLFLRRRNSGDTVSSREGRYVTIAPIDCSGDTLYQWVSSVDMIIILLLIVQGINIPRQGIEIL